MHSQWKKQQKTTKNSDFTFYISWCV